MRSTVLLLTIIFSCGAAHAQDGLTGSPLLPSERKRREALKLAAKKTPRTKSPTRSINTPASKKSGNSLSMLGHLKTSRGEKSSSADEVRIGKNPAPELVAFLKAAKELEKRLEEHKALIIKERSRHVLALQEMLEKLGFLKKKNATYDWRTRSALRSFQRSNKLPVTGRLDSKTLKLLKEQAGVEDYVEPESNIIDPSKSVPIPSATPTPVASTPASSTPSVTAPKPVAPKPTAPKPVAAAPKPAPKPAAPKPAANAPTQLGKSLAAAAARVARRRNTTGRCYAGVADAVDQVIGRFLYGMSAYMAADQLARHPKFKEIKASGSSLKTLPPGAIIVWRKTARSPNGHISVCLGDGREASDHIAPQRTSLRGDARPRVFLVK